MSHQDLGNVSTRYCSGSFGAVEFFTEVDLRAAVDLQQLARVLGEKAARSKGKKATALKGAIVVKVTGQREVPHE